MDSSGRELFFDESMGVLERWYCRIFGVPIVGLRIRLRRISKLLPDHASSILDGGCGRGVISRYLARRYKSAQVDAIDGDERAQRKNIALAKVIGLSNCHHEVADLLDYVAPNKYDLIVSVDNLEHIEDDERVLANYYISMKEGGNLFVHVPHYYRRWPVFGWQENFDVPGHVRPGYHLPQLTERVERAGFEVCETGYSYGFWENLSNNLSYMITGAEERNKIFYALVFPVLNFISWLGQWSKPGMGAGVWVLAKKAMHGSQDGKSIEI